MSDAKKRATLPWVATGFCVVLSLITIVANLWLSIVNHTDVGGWATGFLCFLPMCFFFVGAATSQLRREIIELRAQVANLQESKSSA